MFSVLKGSDPFKFDPTLVNVLASIEGGASELVKQDGTDGWSYVGSKTEQVVINGPLCQKILASSSKVEILLGCPTGQIK